MYAVRNILLEKSIVDAYGEEIRKELLAFEKAADGRATKIIVPSKIQEIAGLVKSITEVAADDEQNPAQ